MTVEEKVLLHLLEFTGQEDSVDQPRDVTQIGIAEAIGIDRKHVPRAVESLQDKELVDERSSHVEAGTRRLKTYHLNWKGIGKAKEIWKGISGEEVFMIFTDGRTGVTTLSKLCFTLQFSKKPMQVITELGSDREYTFDKSEKTAIDPEEEFFGEKEEDKVNMGSDTVWAKSSEDEVGMLKERLYAAALVQAWRDGHLSLDEREMLQEMRRVLGIPAKVHEAIETRIAQAQKENVDPNVKASDIYKATLEESMKDGIITEDENAILRRLRGLLQITPEEHDEIHSDIKEDTGEVDPNAEIYKEALTQAMKDGVITQDESDILIRLRSILGISESTDKTLRRRLIEEKTVDQ